jgi:hypothetical protein
MTSGAWRRRSMQGGVPVRRAQAAVDPDLVAVLHDLTPLVYSHGPVPDQDVPAYVRAASAVRRSGDRLVIVQDEVNVLVVHRDALETKAVLLPAGKGGRRTFGGGGGDKRAKMDLEACAMLPDGRLVAFGSGSTGDREMLVVLSGLDAVRVVDGRALYARLRAERAFSGSELNVEGALVVGDVLRLFQRGNGRMAPGLEPLNATCDLLLSAFMAWLDAASRVPEMLSVTQYDLGQVEHVRLTFADAALMPDERIAFLACAEASPDTYRDGEVLGCRFGIIDGDDVRVGPIVDPDGRLCSLKLEGIETRPGPAVSFDVVADMDRPDELALLGRLDVRNAGRRAPSPGLARSS